MFSTSRLMITEAQLECILVATHHKNHKTLLTVKPYKNPASPLTVSSRHFTALPNIVGTVTYTIK